MLFKKLALLRAHRTAWTVWHGDVRVERCVEKKYDKTSAVLLLGWAGIHDALRLLYLSMLQDKVSVVTFDVQATALVKAAPITTDIATRPFWQCARTLEPSSLDFVLRIGPAPVCEYHYHTALGTQGSAELACRTLSCSASAGFLHFHVSRPLCRFSRSVL